MHPKRIEMLESLRAVEEQLFDIVIRVEDIASPTGMAEILSDQRRSIIDGLQGVYRLIMLIEDRSLDQPR